MIAAESLCGRFCFLVYQCMRPRSSSSFFSVLSRVSRVALTIGSCRAALGLDRRGRLSLRNPGTGERAGLYTGGSL
jgi:hypothetical protein